MKIRQLKEEYDKIFEETFKTYYENGYFGNIPEEQIKAVQYKWFMTVANLLRENKHGELVPFITNHNNKPTREYYSKLTNINIKHKSREDIIGIVNSILWGK